MMMGNISISIDDDLKALMMDRVRELHSDPSKYIRRCIRQEIENSKSPDAIRNEIAVLEAELSVKREQLNILEMGEAKKNYGENVNNSFADYGQIIENGAVECVRLYNSYRGVPGQPKEFQDSWFADYAECILIKYPGMDRVDLIEKVRERSIALRFNK